MKRSLLLLTAALLLGYGCTQSAGEIRVDRPETGLRNSNTLEIDKVIVNDTATILHVDAYFTPRWWIRIDTDTYLQAGGKKYIITGAEGIQLDSLHWMPDSGEDSFVLYFPPLPKGTKSFDFIESDCDECFKIWDIDLTGNATFKSALPKSLREPVLPAADEPLPQAELRAGQTTLEVYLPGIPESYPITRMELFVSNLLKMEQEEFQGVKAGKGMYRFDFGQYGTAYSALVVNNVVIPMILSPGEKAEVHIDLKGQSLGESRYSTFTKVPYVAFTGVYAKVNNEMNLPDEDKKLELDIYSPAFSTDTWKLSDDEFREMIDGIIDENNRRIDRMNASEQLKTIHRQKVKNQAVIAAVHKSIFFTNSESMEKGRGAELTPRPPTEADYLRLISYDLNDPVWMLSNDFNQMSGSLVNSDISDELLNRITGSDSGLLQDMRRMIPVTNALNEDREPSAGMLAELDKASTSFYRESYHMMREQAEKAKAEAMAKGGFEIKETPDVPDDKILEAILAEHKGKPLFVDFWATWCGPCVSAMKTMKPLKADMAERGVVVIYISYTGSPRAKWMGMLPDIGGVHYYLTEEQWRVVGDKYEVEGIPHYMIFDREGRRTFKTAGFPGVDAMKKQLEKVW